MRAKILAFSSPALRPESARGSAGPQGRRVCSALGGDRVGSAGRKAAVFAGWLLLCLALWAPAQARERFLAIEEVKTPSGLSVWLVEDRRVPVIAVDFAFRGAGSALDPADKQGLAQLLSNTLDEGAGDIDSRAFQEELRARSIQLSFSQSRDHFYGSLKMLTRDRDRAAALMALALTRPRFDVEAVARMKAANLSRIKENMTDPQWMAARLMNAAAWSGHPYARNSGGTLATMAALSPDDLRAAVKARFGQNNLVIAIAGDISAQEVPGFVDALFGAVPAVAAQRVEETPVTVHGAGSVTVFDRDIPQSVIEILQPGLRRDNPDYEAALLMNQILGGSGFGSRLTEEVREKRGLTYGVSSSFLDMDQGQALAVSTSTRNETAAQVLDLIRAEWKRMRNEDVTEKELADARSYMIGAMPLALSSTDAIAGLMLSLRLDDRPVDWLDGRAERLRALGPEDVRRVAKKLLDPAGLTVVIVGRPDGVMATNKPEKLPDVE